MVGFCDILNNLFVIPTGVEGSHCFHAEPVTEMTYSNNMIRKLFPVVFFLCLLVRAGFAEEAEKEGTSGETETVSGAPTYKLEDFVVRSSRIREAKEDPSSFTTVISPGQFASQFRTTDDLLSKTPGVNIKRNGGLGQYSTVSIRGSSSEQVLVLLDGIRLNTGEGGSVDFSTVPLDSIERIEVIRGGGTTLYGSDAVGGVVNIVTKDPAGRPELSGAFTYGSLNTLKGWVTASGGTERLSGLLSVTHFQSDGDFDFETPEVWIEGQKITERKKGKRTNNDFFSDNVLAKADLSLARNLNLTVNNDFFYTERGQPGTIFDPRLHARQNLLRNLSHIRLEKKQFLLQDLNIFFTLFNRYDRNHFEDPEPGQGAQGRNPIDTSSWDYAYGIKTGAELFWAGWGTQQRMTFQGEFQREELEDRVEPWQTGYDDPTRMSYEWHFQDEVVLLDNHLTLSPAVHYEESTDFGHHWTAKLGVVAKPLSWLHIQYNVENFFRKPNFSELYYPDQGYIRGNPDLEAEKGKSFDAGFGLDFPRFFFQAAYFRNWVDESIIWLPVSFYTIQPVNTGPVDQWGFEVDSECRPVDPLFLSANYTYLHAVTEDTGQQQHGRPRHTVNFKAALTGRLGEIYTEAQYLSRIPVFFTRTANVAIDPRFVVDLGVTLNLLSLPRLERMERLSKWTLSFEVKNVGDVSVYDSQYFPLPGRMFFLTLHAAL